MAKKNGNNRIGGVHMKNKNEKESFLKENGFLIALYSIVGVLVVVALSLTVLNDKPTKEVKEDTSSLSVDNSLTKSYKEQEQVVSREEISFMPETINENVEKEEVKVNEENVEVDITAESNESSETVIDMPKSEDLPITSNENETKEDVPVSITYMESLDEKIAKANGSDTDVNSEEVVEKYEEESREDTVYNNESDNSDEETVYNNESDNSGEESVYNDSYSFSETSKMIWPTLGDLVMLFSSDVLVYDRTLEQYRTNDSISIAAEAGSTVLAATDGKVVDVNENSKNGKFVTLEHGNGWQTTYSQIDDIVVSLGDHVVKGDILGKVGSPTKYGVNLGSHLDFKVTRNEVAINPMNVLN